MNSIFIIYLRIIAVIILFIILFSLLQFFISVHPPKYSEKTNPESYGLDYEDITLTSSDNIKIRAWLIKSDKANSTIIIGHGYPFDKSNILPITVFLYPDYNILLYDHRYFGKSSGYISTLGIKEVEDVKATINYINKIFPEQKVVLYGFSLSASTMLMTKEKVDAIIADSPYANLENMVNHVYSIFGPFKFVFVEVTNLLSIIFFRVHPKQISPATSVKNTTIPILIIHGSKDTQIPVENAYELKDSNQKIELMIFKNADHGQSYALYQTQYIDSIKDFLKKHINNKANKP